MRHCTLRRIVKISILCSMILIVGICSLVYFNTIRMKTVDLKEYPIMEGSVVYDIQYVGDLSRKTELVATESSDKVTRLEMIEGNGYQEDYIEIAGYAYVPSESIELFDVSVILTTGEDTGFQLNTHATPSQELTDKEGNGQYNYTYAYFKCVVPKKKLKSNETYQILLLYGNNGKDKQIVETTTYFTLGTGGAVEVSYETN